MQAELDHLDALADTLEELASQEVVSLDYGRYDNVSGDWIDPRGSAYWHAWCEICDCVKARFAPLNYVRNPESGLQGVSATDAHHRLELVTLAPQDDPQVKLHVIYWADGDVEVRAAFDNPTDGSWELLFRGDIAEYDEQRARQTRNRLVYIREGWERADELKERTVLSSRESQIQALAERGYDDERIAEILGMERETVDALSTRLEERVERARNTVELLGE